MVGEVLSLNGVVGWGVAHNWWVGGVSAVVGLSSFGSELILCGGVAHSP